MDGLIAQVRRASGLTQEELAARSGTSRPTLSAYENERKSPTLATAARIAAAAGFVIDVVPRVSFREVAVGRGRVVHVPDRLWRLPVERALGRVSPPLHLDWSTPGRTVDLGDRRRRARLYEVVLREGAPGDLLEYVDGVLLVEGWDDLVLPRTVRDAWHPVVRAALHTPPPGSIGVA